MHGPLTVCATNPRYFEDAAGRVVLLTGSHHWDSLVDNAERPGGFDYPAYLERLVDHGHSFVRLWAQWAWCRSLTPRVYRRTGPGRGRDGGLRFDLERFEPAYFDRLRRRVLEAGRRGLWVSVMLFSGWALEDHGEGDPWPAHPYHRDNNINGIDGDPEGGGTGVRVHTLRAPAITRLQEAYVRRVVDTVGDLPHVLYEVSNESRPGSLAWQRYLARYLEAHGRRRGRARPVGMSAFYGGGRDGALLSSPVDWISPHGCRRMRRAPPAATGEKVSLLDTDHLWGLGGSAAWVWKSFLRGHNPIVMDPLDDDAGWEALRRALGQVRRWAERVDLGRLEPRPRWASSGYCLAGETADGWELLAWSPAGRRLAVDLSALPAVPGALTWYGTESGERSAAGTLRGGARYRLKSPFRGAALLHGVACPRAQGGAG